MNAAIQAVEQRDYLPPTIMVQVSGRCNLRCTMCAHPEEQDNQGRMELKLFRRLLDELEAVGINALVIAGAWGEPFLHPEIFTFLEEATARKFRVTISTNMTPLNEEKILRLLHLGLDTIQLSFAGHDKETYESVYVRGTFSHAQLVLKWFKELLKTHPGPHPKLRVNGCILDPAPETPAKTFQFLKELGYRESEIELKVPCNFAGQISIAEGNAWLEGKPDISSLSFCSVIKDSLGILFDGRITACGCLDRVGHLALGDLNTQSFKQIVHGDRFKEILEAFRNFDLKGLMCEDCDVPYGNERMIRLFPSHHVESIRLDELEAQFRQGTVALAPAGLRSRAIYDQYSSAGSNRLILVDNHCAGEMYRGHRICHPDELSTIGFDFVVINGSPHQEELLNQCFDLNIPDGKIKRIIPG